MKRENIKLVQKKHIRNDFIELCEEINKSHPEMTEDQYKELILDEIYTVDIKEMIATLRGYICEEQIKFFSDTMHALAEPGKTLSRQKMWYKKLKKNIWNQGRMNIENILGYKYWKTTKEERCIIIIGGNSLLLFYKKTSL